MTDPKEIIEVCGHAVTISNPGKICFPQRGITKLDVVRYYLAVAKGALRGVAGRPMVLKRYVNGAAGEAFFQKRAPASRPAWIETVELKFPSGRSAEEVVVTDAAGLAWVANLGCIDLNPHPVRVSDLDHPDELRVDLDPVPGVPYGQILDVAMVARDTMADFGLTGWPKTSGSRGFHIYARIEPRWTFTEVRSCAVALAREIERPAGRVRGLQPECQGPDRRERLLAAAGARCPGLHPAEVGGGTGLRSQRVHDRDCSAAPCRDR
jgi:bifunctional non-homologous end joining protein LigD